MNGGTYKRVWISLQNREEWAENIKNRKILCAKIKRIENDEQKSKEQRKMDEKIKDPSHSDPHTYAVILQVSLKKEMDPISDFFDYQTHQRCLFYVSQSNPH